MTRLTYKRFPDSPILIAKYPILCNNKMVNVSLNFETLVYKIYEVDGVLAEGQGKSLNDCKKKIKNNLILLGANFTSEIRNRGNTKKL